MSIASYFGISLFTLLLGHLLYGPFVERVFGIDKKRRTPAIALEDGVDYVTLPKAELFLNQFLSISGIGPVFGALMGALYGPSAFFWIVLGSIFAGGVHDYLAGMISLRYRGISVPEMVGIILGPAFKQFMRLFALFLLILLGVVFVQAPASLISGMTRVENDFTFWAALIFIYYFIATVAPIEIILSRLNPFFTLFLAIMAVGLMGAIFLYEPRFYEPIPWANPHPGNLPVWPLMFVTIACGAISGFHSTQSFITSRCIAKESLGRSVFYSAMILESVIALIWAVIGMTFYYPLDIMHAALRDKGPAEIVSIISNNMLGELGGVLALLGVAVLPLTSGDKSFRASRLIIADISGLDQKKLINRLLIAVPLFITAIIVIQQDFDHIWRYFAWSNQSLAAIVLWAGAAYMIRNGRKHYIASIPAVFMTSMTVTYILYSELGLSLKLQLSTVIGCGAGVLAFVVLLLSKKHFIATVPLSLDNPLEWENKKA